MYALQIAGWVGILWNFYKSDLKWWLNSEGTKLIQSGADLKRPVYQKSPRTSAWVRAQNGVVSAPWEPDMWLRPWLRTYLLQFAPSDAILKRELSSEYKAVDCPITCKNSVHKGTPCPLLSTRTRSRPCTRVLAPCPNTSMGTWKKGVFTLVSCSEYCSRAPCQGTSAAHSRVLLQLMKRNTSCRNHASVSSREFLLPCLYFHSRRGSDNSPIVQFELTTDPVSNRANSDVWLFHLQTQSIQTAQNKRQAWDW